MNLVLKNIVQIGNPLHNMNQCISIIIPLYNEEFNIPRLMAGLEKLTFADKYSKDIIFVDDVIAVIIFSIGI